MASPSGAESRRVSGAALGCDFAAAGLNVRGCGSAPLPPLLDRPGHGVGRIIPDAASRSGGRSPRRAAGKRAHASHLCASAAITFEFCNPGAARYGADAGPSLAEAFRAERNPCAAGCENPALPASDPQTHSPGSFPNGDFM